jgi:hypothetical protein
MMPDPYEPPRLTYLGRWVWYPAAMPEPKPTPARMVLFFPKGESKPWPAVVVDVVEDKVSGAVRCDLQPFPTRGHGPQSLRLGVPFSEKPGVVDTCCYPPRVEPPAPPAEPPIPPPAGVGG